MFVVVSVAVNWREPRRQNRPRAFSSSGLSWNAAPSLRNLVGDLDRGHKADGPDRAILGNDWTFLLLTHAQFFAELTVGATLEILYMLLPVPSCHFE